MWYYILQGVGAPEASEHKGNLKDDLYDISALHEEYAQSHGLAQTQHDIPVIVRR